jgi:hypothetical protein
VIAVSLLVAILLLGLAWVALIPVCAIQRLSQPTILGTAFLIALAAHFLPACVFLFDPTMPQAHAFFWATTLCLLLLPVGGALANVVFRFAQSELKTFYPTAIGTPPPLRDRLLILCFALFLFGVLGMYVSEVKSYPFGLLLRGDVDTAILNSLRHEAIGPQMGSHFWYLYGLTRSSFMPMLFALILSGWAYFRGGLERSIAVLSLIAALVFNSWSGAKTPVAMLFLLGLFVMVMKGHVTRKESKPARRPRPFRRLATLGVLAMLVVAYPVFVFSRKAFGQTHSVLEVLYEGVFKRIFFKPALLSYYQFEMFPTHYPFTGFRDISKIAQLFGLEYVDLSTLTALYSTGTDLANLPPAAFGNFYAQGGWPMLLLGALMVGFVLQAMQIWFVRFSPRNSFALGLLAVLLWCGFRVSMTGFHNIFLSEGIVPTLIFITVWRLWRAGSGAAMPVPTPSASR